MTRPRQWPAHPAPIDGETLSSWLHRIAACYSTDLTHLGDDLGFTLGWRPPEDIDVAATSAMINVLAERTGVTPDRLRQMSVAGWVPWRLDNSDEVQQAEQRTCRFPECVHPAVSADSGSGRPPEYCDHVGHNRAAAWRARRRLAAEPSRNIEDEKRPVDAARQRAGELSDQVAGMLEHLGQQLTALIEELRIVADPDAAEAQIESVTTEAATQVALQTPEPAAPSKLNVKPTWSGWKLTPQQRKHQSWQTSCTPTSPSLSLSCATGHLLSTR
ncbi:TniQ family protein [Cryobacterium sp. TMT2-42-4]|uniref:TniQ family protein n=1 Tax=Cryobacterium sp. TMT2-42-4 TaxID=1259255 RepID=UPI00141B572A|nr:TniQ family protein [Cryobacterium sp. TMT2-42-4]